MSGGMEWAAKHEREQLGKVIKKIVDKMPEENLGKLFKTITRDLKELEKDGKFSRQGLHLLDSTQKNVRLLITEVVAP